MNSHSLGAYLSQHLVFRFPPFFSSSIQTRSLLGPIRQELNSSFVPFRQAIFAHDASSGVLIPLSTRLSDSQHSCLLLFPPASKRQENFLCFVLFQGSLNLPELFVPFKRSLPTMPAVEFNGTIISLGDGVSGVGPTFW